MKLVKIKITSDLLREFLQNVLSCEYDISNSLNQELIPYNKNIYALTDYEIRELAERVFTSPPIRSLVNLKVDKVNYKLAMIYTDFYSKSSNNELFTLGKYGIQCIDLFNKRGMILYSDAYSVDFHTENYVEIMEQSSKIKIFRYRPDKEDLEFLAEPKGNILARLISFEESLFYFNGAFVDENFQSTTPNCFDNGKWFSEGLAPVCLNGKWGYINKKSEVVIDFIYGAAEPFENGKARVFVLKSDYLIEKGIWLDANPYEGYKQEQFLSLFPKFPSKIRKPLSFIRDGIKTNKQLIDEYHYFAEGMHENCGYWAERDLNGQLFNVAGNKKITLTQSDSQAANSQVRDQAYWFNLIINGGERDYLLVRDLPDALFIDKPFVYRILESAPNLFKQFNVLYSDDADICKLAFNDSFRNYNFFSERMKGVYRERYDQKLAEEAAHFLDVGLAPMDLDDDLPF